MYSSIRILAVISKCGLIDDVDSLWYSTLHLLAVFDMKEVAKAYISMPAYMFQNKRSSTIVRAGCVQDGNRCLREFGAQYIPDGPLRYFLNRLHKLLFLGKDSKNISAGMAVKPYSYMREYEIGDLEWLFEPNLCKRLQGKSMADVSSRK